MAFVKTAEMKISFLQKKIHECNLKQIEDTLMFMSSICNVFTLTPTVKIRQYNFRTIEDSITLEFNFPVFFKY